MCMNKFVSLKGSAWKEKAENLESELQQCYKAQSRLSEQLVVEVAESRASKSLLREKEELIATLQNDLSQARLSLTTDFEDFNFVLNWYYMNYSHMVFMLQ